MRISICSSVDYRCSLSLRICGISETFLKFKAQFISNIELVRSQATDLSIGGAITVLVDMGTILDSSTARIGAFI